MDSSALSAIMFDFVQTLGTSKCCTGCACTDRRRRQSSGTHWQAPSLSPSIPPRQPKLHLQTAHRPSEKSSCAGSAKPYCCSQHAAWVKEPELHAYMTCIFASRSPTSNPLGSYASRCSKSTHLESTRSKRSCVMLMHYYEPFHKSSMLKAWCEHGEIRPEVMLAHLTLLTISHPCP